MSLHEGDDVAELNLLSDRFDIMLITSSTLRACART
jgi:hypothetical protein